MDILIIKSQFHYGSIQTKNLKKLSYEQLVSLNSTMVQFKLKDFLIKQGAVTCVSIPLWFNSNILAKQWGMLPNNASLNSTMVQFKL